MHVFGNNYRLVLYFIVIMSSVLISLRGNSLAIKWPSRMPINSTPAVWNFMAQGEWWQTRQCRTPWSKDFWEKCLPCACFLDIFITYSMFILHLTLKSRIENLLDIYLLLKLFGQNWMYFNSMATHGCAWGTYNCDGRYKDQPICREWHLPGLI